MKIQPILTTNGWLAILQNFNEWLCAMEPHWQVKETRLKQGLNQELLDQQVRA